MSDNREHAFPVSTVDGLTQHGMTLRDYFAAKALSGMARISGIEADYPFYTALAAYQIADLMLEARKIKADDLVRLLPSSEAKP